MAQAVTSRDAAYDDEIKRRLTTAIIITSIVAGSTGALIANMIDRDGAVGSMTNSAGDSDYRNGSRDGGTVGNVPVPLRGAVTPTTPGTTPGTTPATTPGTTPGTTPR